MTGSDNEVRKLADELPFHLSEQDIERISEAKDELNLTANSIYKKSNQGSFEQSQSQDDYNSLLAVYENPSSFEGDTSEFNTLPLKGKSIAVKDNIAVKGLSMTCGLDAESFVPSFDATVVSRLRQSGATIYGKANMDALAFGPSGEFSQIAPVKNPCVSGLVPGGSSSGSGAAVAGEVVDIALGTDTGGSIRIPAACCDIVGMKPTHGLIPTHGLVEFAPSLDTIGPLARSVEEAEDAFNSIAPADAMSKVGVESYNSETKSDSEHMSIGVLEPYFEVSTDVVSSAVRDAISEVSNAGIIDTKSIELETDLVEDIYPLIGATEFGWLLKQNGVNFGGKGTYEEGFREGVEDLLLSGHLTSHIANRVLPSLALDIEEKGRPYVAAWEEVKQFQADLADRFGEVDVLVTPTIRSLPPKQGEIGAEEDMNNLVGNTSPFNLTGMPAVSLPLKNTEDIISIQIIAPQFRDQDALRVAKSLEETLSG